MTQREKEIDRETVSWVNWGLNERKRREAGCSSSNYIKTEGKEAQTSKNKILLKFFSGRQEKIKREIKYAKETRRSSWGKSSNSQGNWTYQFEVSLRKRQV